jgi:hypothetical protein
MLVEIVFLIDLSTEKAFKLTLKAVETHDVSEHPKLEKRIMNQNCCIRIREMPLKHR